MAYALGRGAGLSPSFNLSSRPLGFTDISCRSSVLDESSGVGEVQYGEMTPLSSSLAEDGEDGKSKLKMLAVGEISPNEPLGDWGQSNEINVW